MKARTAVSMPPRNSTKPGADQVAHAFDVGHDARDQRTGAVLVVIGHGKQAHVALHLAAQFGDQPLAGLGKQLRERIRGERLHCHGSKHDEDDARQQFGVRMLRRQHLVEQRLRHEGQHQAREAVDDHQHEAAQDEPLARSHEGLDFRPDFSQVRFGFGQVGLAGACAAPVRRALGAHAHSHSSAAKSTHALSLP